MSTKNRQKRHCMIVHAYYPVGETRVQREALALIDAGYAVDVICLREQGEAPRAGLACWCSFWNIWRF